MLEKLLARLVATEPAAAKDAFTDLYCLTCELLEYDDAQAAEVFDTSRPTASRWRRGKVIPPAARLVLKFAREEVDGKLKKLKQRGLWNLIC